MVDDNLACLRDTQRLCLAIEQDFERWFARILQDARAKYERGEMTLEDYLRKEHEIYDGWWPMLNEAKAARQLTVDRKYEEALRRQRHHERKRAAAGTDR